MSALSSKPDHNHESGTNANGGLGAQSSQAASNPTVGEPSAFVSPSISVADQLRMARVNRGLTIDEVSVRLNLRPASIEAMEAGAYEKLPGAAYVAGFVHSYARLLMLDGAALVSQLKIETTVLQPKPVNELPLKVSQRAFPSAGYIWTGLILLLGLLLLWTVTNNKFVPEMVTAEASNESAVPPSPAADDVDSPEEPEQLTLPAPSSPSSPSTMAPTASSAPAGTPATVPPTPAPAPVPASNNALAPATPAPAPASPVASTAPAPNAPAATTATAVTITAKQNSWIQLRDGKGAVVVAKLLRAGESFPLPNTPGLMMTTGNAGGTFITVNGQPSAPLGQENQVVREIPLDAAPLADYLAKLSSSPNQ